jgi:multiple antibiotic resistance protein
VTPAAAALAFVSLLVIVDPVALAPVFAALTAGMAPERARRAALLATLAGFGLIAAAGLAGHLLLRAAGTEPGLVHVVVAGALMAIGAAMLLGRGGLQGFETGARRRDPTFVPLAVPLIAGPGALGTMVVLTGKHAGHPGALAALYGVLAVVGALTYAALRLAGPIAARLGERGVRLITRIMGLVLMAAAARFAFEGLRDWGVIGRGAAG